MQSSPRRLGRLAAAGVTLLLAAALVPGAQPSISASADAATPDVHAPSLFGAAPSVDGRALVTGPGPGRHRLVGLRTGMLPKRAAGQQVTFDLFRNASFTGTFQHTFHGRGYTSWSGVLSTPLSSFTITRAGSVYRMDLSSPKGNYEITQASGGAYWVTQPQAPTSYGTHSDVAAPPAAPVARPAAQRLTPRKLHDSGAVLDVLFAYNDQLMAQAGSYNAILAYAGSIVTDTNTALAQSGDGQIQVRLVGLARTATNNSPNLDRNLTWLRKPHDGHYDDLVKARNRTHADVVHLLVAGTDPKWCGFGYEPVNPRSARPSLGFSLTEYANCSINHSPTHELGHNMGADHDRYPGVTHYSHLSYAAGLVNVPQGWLSIMAYPNHVLNSNPSACCTYLLYYTNPALSYNGTAVGGQRQFNAKAIAQVEPQVARYKLGAIYHSKIRIKGRARVGHRLRVRPGRWAPRHKVHFTYQWTLDGSGIPHKTHRHLRIKGSYFGHQLGVIVTGHARHYPAATAGKTLDRTIRRGHMNPARLRMRGNHHVGAKLTLELHLRHWHPRPSIVKISWFRGSHKIKGAHGIHYRLRTHDRHHRVHARVKYRHYGYFQVVRSTAKVLVH